MKLTKEEQEICNEYRKPEFRDGTMYIRCFQCPLVLSRRYCVCKANVEEDEIDERRANEPWFSLYHIS